MKHPHLLLLSLALCLGTVAPLALAAGAPNTVRTPSEQIPGTGTIDRNGGATGSGTPGDAMGSGNGGTDANNTDNTGGDGTSQGSSGERGPGTGNSGDVDDAASSGDSGINDGRKAP
ncbi:hypothetical protein [Pseudomonas sp. NY15354]|uniref:hypothetical protein n=1 Tax=Pseudomonas sp. NY15354 TaxID=3400351 RepID=UPI003A88D055